MGFHLQQGCRAELGVGLGIRAELVVERQLQFRVVDFHARCQGGQERVHRHFLAAELDAVVGPECCGAAFDHARQQRHQYIAFDVFRVARGRGLPQWLPQGILGRFAARRLVGMDEGRFDAAMFLQGFVPGSGVGIGPDRHLHTVEIRLVGKRIGGRAEIMDQAADRFVIRGELAILDLQVAGNGHGP